MRISDWSSDVCSSDLKPLPQNPRRPGDGSATRPDADAEQPRRIGDVAQDLAVRTRRPRGGGYSAASASISGTAASLVNGRGDCSTTGSASIALPAVSMLSDSKRLALVMTCDSRLPTKAL